MRTASDSDLAQRALCAFVKVSVLMGLPIDDDCLAGVAGWLDFYQSWEGRRVVGFVTPEDIATKLIADSFAVAYLGLAPKPGSQILDLGSGNGWPGLAARFLWPASPTALLDSRLGACQFLEAYTQAVCLSGVCVLPLRAEEAGKLDEYVGAFDFVLTRAMAAPGVALELSVPFLAKGGHVVLWLGPEHEETLRSAGRIEELGLRRQDIAAYSLPQGRGSRFLGVFRREGNPKQGYPRALSSIKRKPLL